LQCGVDEEESHDMKGWHSSRTIWDAAISILAPLMHFTGVDIGPEERSQIVDPM
jgi:hypothetical protein